MEPPTESANATASAQSCEVEVKSAKPTRTTRGRAAVPDASSEAADVPKTTRATRATKRNSGDMAASKPNEPAVPESKRTKAEEPKSGRVAVDPTDEPAGADDAERGTSRPTRATKVLTHIRGNGPIAALARAHTHTYMHAHVRMYGRL